MIARDREKAVTLIVQEELKSLPPGERLEILEEVRLCDWSDDLYWNNLETQVRDRLSNETSPIQLDEASRTIFDDAIAMSLRLKYELVENSYLERRFLEFLGEGIKVIGNPKDSVACPCCGHSTLEERGGYEICPVCFWEDDGSDNEGSDLVLGGPNGVLSLTQARFNYLKAGNCEGKRLGPRIKLKSPEMYKKCREFVFDREQGILRETGSTWKSSDFDR